MPRAKHPIVEFEGVRFYTKPSGYFVAAPNRAVLGERYLHRAVWAYHNGPIPDGYCVHHRDHDKKNNAISNLELLTGAAHMSHHNQERYERDPESVLRGIQAAQLAAPAWHRSAAGREWHRQHAIKSYKTREREQRTCVRCGKQYQGVTGLNKKGFCSMSCQGAARVASGVDDVDCTCAWCGGTFRRNKYKVPATCSPACAAKNRERNNKSLRPNGG